MGIHRLSSAAERISAAAVAGVLAALMGLVLYALRKEPLSLILIGFAVLLAAGVLVFYLVSLFRSACRAVPQERRLLIRGLPDDSLDLSRAASVKTVPCATGPVRTRSLVFSDENGGTVATVPTFFTVRQGAQAEPLAAALAKELGLDFLPGLEPWEYDRSCRAEHEKEAAAARKAARKAKLHAIKKKNSPGAAAGDSSPSVFPEENTVVQGGKTAPEPDNINYDALDDEK